MSREKDELRRELRGSPPPSREVVRQIVSSVMGMPEWFDADICALFAPHRHEPDIEALFDENGKIRLVPRVIGERLDLVAITTRPGGEGWRRGAFGLWEPVGEPARETPRFVLVPGVAFGRDGSRLGRGGGFYDRLLSDLPHAFRCGVCTDERLFDAVPTEPHDASVDAIVTPSCVIRTGRPGQT